MASQDRDIPRDIKPPLNMESYDPSYIGIITDIKGEMEEYDGLTSIKIEHGTLDDCDVVYQKQDINVDTICDIADNKPTWHDLEDNTTNVYTKRLIKDEPGTFISDTKSFQPTVIKIEDDDDLSDSESKYNKEDQFIILEEGTSSSRNTESNVIGDDAGSSPSVIKMEEDEDITSESSEGEDRESREQYPGRKIRHIEKTFDCIKCEKKFSSKYCLSGHIVSQHSNNGEMMDSVTCKIHHCKYCSYLTVKTKRFTQHMMMHGEKSEKSVDCIKCKKVFSCKRDLDSHTLTRHRNNVKMMNSVTSNIHRCKHCKYITVYAYKLARHIRMHEEKLEKNFDCIKCRKEFPGKFTLDAHIVARHSNNDEMMNSVTSTIHRCKHCSFITVHPNGFTLHMRTHVEKTKKTFNCTKCKREFMNKQNLDGHIVARHNNNGEMMNSVTSKIHCCKHCKYITVSANSFTQHVRTHGKASKQASV